LQLETTTVTGNCNWKLATETGNWQLANWQLELETKLQLQTATGNWQLQLQLQLCSGNISTSSDTMLMF
jgi:hypothetical protein